MKMTTPLLGSTLDSHLNDTAGVGVYLGAEAGTTPAPDSYNGNGAAMFVIAVVATYGISIVFMLGLTVRRRNRSEVSVTKFLYDIQAVQDQNHTFYHRIQKEKTHRHLSRISTVTEPNDVTMGWADVMTPTDEVFEVNFAKPEKKTVSFEEKVLVHDDEVQEMLDEGFVVNVDTLEDSSNEST